MYHIGLLDSIVLHPRQFPISQQLSPRAALPVHRTRHPDRDVSLLYGLLLDWYLDMKILLRNSPFLVAPPIVHRLGSHLVHGDISEELVGFGPRRFNLGVDWRLDTTVLSQEDRMIVLCVYWAYLEQTPLA